MALQILHVCKDFGIKNVAEYHDLYLSECPFLMPGARGVFDPHINRAKTFGTPTRSFKKFWYP